MKKYISLLAILFLCGALKAQLPTFTSAHVKTYFDTASSATMSAFADSMNANWMNAWQSRFDFTNKNAFLSELALVPQCERTYLATILSSYWVYSKDHPELRDSVAIDHSGFSFISDDPPNPALSKTKTNIHTDWVFLTFPPYIVLASVWVTKETKK